MDPWEDLREVLIRLPTMTASQIEEVTPDAWAKKKPTPAQPPAPRSTTPSQAVA